MLLPLILALCLVPASLVNKHCNATKQWVENAVFAAEQGDFIHMLQYSEAAEMYWNDHNKLLTAILRHDDSGAVEIGLVKMISFAKMQDEDEFRAVCVEVLEHLKHIQEQELPLLKNVF